MRTCGRRLEDRQQFGSQDPKGKQRNGSWEVRIGVFGPVLELSGLTGYVESLQKV